MNRTRSRSAVIVVAVSVIAVSVAATGCAGATKVDATGEGGSSASSGSPDSTGATIASTSTTQPPPVECLSELTTEQKVGQTLMVLVADPGDASAAVAAGEVGGYALIGNQDDTVGAAIGAVNASAPLPVFAAGDEEGGSVQRLRNVLGRLPSAREMAEGSSPEDAAATFGDYAGRMAGLGLNMNLGPSADVGTGAGLGNRTFSDDADAVLSYAAAISTAVRAAGVVPVAKHWPGIGSGDVDPHQGVTTVDDIETLRSGDLRVFDGLFDAGVPAVMVSHAIVPGLTDDRPASLSSAAIGDELRGRQGFTGVVITDSLGMGAVSARFDNPRAALEAIVAGADIALLSGVAFVDAATALLVAAVAEGTLSIEQLDASVDRILRLKGVTGPCPLPDAA